MARRTAALKPQLNQIRTWAREGRTDAWIAYQLGTTSATVQEFRFEYGLDKGAGNPVEEPVTPELVVQTISFDSPPPLPPLEPAPPAAETSADELDAAPTRRQRRSRPGRVDADALQVEVAGDESVEIEAAADGEPESERPKRRRRRGGRGGAGASSAVEEPTAGGELPAETAAEPGAKPARAAARRKPRGTASYRGSVVAGAVLVLDPAVTRSAAWRAHWTDAPEFDVTVEDDQIVLRRRAVD